MRMILAAIVFSVALGADIHHAQGEPFVEMRLESKVADVWFSLYGVGAGLHWGDKVRFGLGVEYGSAREQVETRLAYALRLEYRLSKQWGLGVKHRSNCRKLCRGDLLRPFNLGNDGHNRGYNYLYLRRKF